MLLAARCRLSRLSDVPVGSRCCLLDHGCRVSVSTQLSVVECLCRLPLSFSDCWCPALLHTAIFIFSVNTELTLVAQIIRGGRSAYEFR